MNLIISTLTDSRTSLRALFFTIIPWLFLVPASAADLDYEEARVYVTGTATGHHSQSCHRPFARRHHPGRATAQRPWLLCPRAASAEPDEDIPTIIIDDKKTFQTIIRFWRRLHRCRGDHLCTRLPHDRPGAIPQGLLRPG